MQVRRKFVLAAVLGVMTLLLAEVGFRIVVCAKAGSLRPLLASVVRNESIEASHQTRNHALVAGTTFVSTGYPPGMEFCVYSTISSQGFHDDELPEEKDPGEVRILVLGDSFVEAKQVCRKENFCELLETRLSADLNTTVRVINAGVSSYSPILEYIYYMQIRDLVQPDVVLQVFFANDVFDDLRYSQTALSGPDGSPIAVPPGVPWLSPDPENPTANTIKYRKRAHSLLATRDGLTSMSYIASQLSHVSALRRLENEFPDPPRNEEFFILEDDPRYDDAKLEGWSRTARFIGLLKNACEADGVRYVLSSAPIAAQVYGRTSYDHFFFKDEPNNSDVDNLMHIANSLNAELIDLLEPLKVGGEGLYLSQDGHWTAAGHRVVADSLFKPLLSLLEAEGIGHQEMPSRLAEDLY